MGFLIVRCDGSMELCALPVPKPSRQRGPGAPEASIPEQAKRDIEAIDPAHGPDKLGLIIQRPPGGLPYRASCDRWRPLWASRFACLSETELCLSAS